MSSLNITPDLIVTATINPGDINIGSVQIKDATSSLEANVKSDGVNNALVVTQNSQPLPTGAATEATLSSLNSKVVAVNTGAVTISSSVLPTGAATETTLAGIKTDTDKFTFSSNALLTTRVGATLNTNQVSVGSTATLIIAANANRRRLILINMGTTNVFIGNSGVTIGTGQLLLGIAGYPIPLYYTGAVYGIVGTGSQTIAYLEEAA